MENIKLTKIGNYCYWNNQTEQVILNNKSIKLTISETKLLKIFINSMNKPISSVDLYFYIWDDYQKEFNGKSIRNLVSSLRKTLPEITIKNIYGGFYILQKLEQYPDDDFKDYLFEFLDQSQNGIIITNPNKKDNPIIYVNSAFTNLFEYTLEEIKGNNCRFMHGTDNEQLSLQDIKIAIEKESSITVNVRNYTKTGSLIYNEVTISPIFDKQKGKLKGVLEILCQSDKIISRIDADGRNRKTTI